MRVGGTINRRIGGLEIPGQSRHWLLLINRRIGGLEIKVFKHSKKITINRRIGGLEKHDS